jgi:hypothetical protein
MSLVRFLKKVAVDFLLVVLARPDCHEVNEAIPRFQKFLPHLNCTVPPVFYLESQRQLRFHGAVGKLFALT